MQLFDPPLTITRLPTLSPFGAIAATLSDQPYLASESYWKVFRLINCCAGMATNGKTACFRFWATDHIQRSAQCRNVLLRLDFQNLST